LSNPHIALNGRDYEEKLQENENKNIGKICFKIRFFFS
jgi:hypothetical protein